MMQRNMGLGLLLVGSLLLVGCGDTGNSLNVQYVEGVVTLDGQPLEGALITFVSQNEGGLDAGGFSDAKGIYKLSSTGGDPERGAVMGEYTVTVSKVEINDPTVNMSYEEASASKLQPTQKQLLPVVYQNRKNSPLSATVNKGKNKINIELKSKP